MQKIRIFIIKLLRKLATVKTAYYLSASIRKYPKKETYSNCETNLLDQEKYFLGFIKKVNRVFSKGARSKVL